MEELRIHGKALLRRHPGIVLQDDEVVLFPGDLPARGILAAAAFPVALQARATRDGTIRGLGIREDARPIFRGRLGERLDDFVQVIVVELAVAHEEDTNRFGRVFLVRRGEGCPGQDGYQNERADARKRSQDGHVRSFSISTHAEAYRNRSGTCFLTCLCRYCCTLCFISRCRPSSSVGLALIVIRLCSDERCYDKLQTTPSTRRIPMT